MTDTERSELQWGTDHLRTALAEEGYDRDRFALRFETESIDDDVDGFADQGFRIRTEGETVTVAAPSTTGQLYGLVELAERVRHGDEDALSVDPGDRWEYADAPAMEYRGYCLGLQKPTGYYPDHRAYDWPITPEHFPWFYDREFLTRLLDRLGRHRANTLYLWSGHPFASLVDVTDEYPKAPEVEADQLEENIEQYRWLCSEAAKRGIWIVQHFYNIHMSDPLAKDRGWEITGKRAHEGVTEYTRECIREFVSTYPSVALMPTMGEELREEDSAKWLNEVILPSVLEGLGDDPETYPPVVVRAHGTSLEEYLPEAKALYPALSTVMKHNNEDYTSTVPDPGNTVLARMSGSHVINVHTVSNLEPFSWGSPRFVRRTVANMLDAEATGVHVYPLRYWDCPHSSRVDPLGDQLYEHFLWWSAWSRYAWDPNRDEAAEDRFWERELAKQYDLSGEQAGALLDARQETGPVLPQIAGQFTITSGNRQANPLGLHLVSLAFSNREYMAGRTYGMAQMCGFPVLGETMWTESPATRMERMQEKCESAIETLDGVAADPVIEADRQEIEAMRLIAQFYEQKAWACTRYFQRLYGMDVDADEAESHLEDSVETYAELADVTGDLFEDAASLHHHRTVPVRADEGYLHWEDVLPVFEEELELAREEGIEGLLADMRESSSPHTEYYEGFVVDEV